MKKQGFVHIIKESLTSTKAINTLIFISFAILFSVLLASKYFFFQSIVNNDNTSRVDVVSPKTIEVIDTFKTEQRRNEAAQKVEPILTPAEDSYIKNNLNGLVNSIQLIRKKDIKRVLKQNQLDTLVDIAEPEREQYIISYFLNADDTSVQLVASKAKKTLDNVLQEGVTEKDFEQNNILRTIKRNIDPTATRTQIKVISGLIEQVIMPNMVVDEVATELAKKNAMDSVMPTVITFQKGEKIIYAGEPITKLKRDALNKAGYNILQINYKGVMGIFCLVVIGMFSLIYYLKYFEKQYLTGRYISIMALSSILLTICAVALPDKVSVYWIPFPAFAIILSIFINSRASFLISTVLITIVSLSLQFPAAAMSVFIITTLVSTINIIKIKYSRRFDLIKIGFEIAGIMVIAIASIYLLELCVIDVETQVIIRDIEAGLANGFLCGVLVLGLLPLLESIFGVISPYGLAELADHNQPLLRRLQFEAPGTFSHSLMVSTLSEAAAEAIGANPILARVGALYHDIGKIKRPLFFVENQTYFGIDNPHTKLNPRLSKMVITAHPKDGIDLAKEYGLPVIIQNFIAQHHGNALASYFYNQALQQEGEENVKEEQFRYTGPKPNMKETAILMIADAVESASRTLKDHSQEELEELINKLISERLNDGQLSDSPLTLQDLKTIAATFSRVLRAAHHQRIKYHENIIEELENKARSKSLITSKITNTELEDKIEKKIQKHQHKHNNANP